MSSSRHLHAHAQHERATGVSRAPCGLQGWSLPIFHLSCDGAFQDYNGDAAQQKQYWKDLVKGWQLPLYQRLVEATQPANILKSHIYQR